MQLNVKCPHCLEVSSTNKTKGTQIRCPKRDRGCGKRFYVSDKTIVLENETVNKTNEAKTRQNMHKTSENSSKSEVKNDNTKTIVISRQDRQDNNKTNGKTIPISISIIPDLIIMANYAINSIRKKPDVVNEKENTTYYSYFQKWNIYREYFRKKEKEYLKKLIKNG